MESKLSKKKNYCEIASISTELISQEKLASCIAKSPVLKMGIEKGLAGALNPRLLGAGQGIRPGTYNFIQQSAFPMTIYYTRMTGHPGLVRYFQFDNKNIANQLLCAGEFTVNHNGMVIGVIFQTGNYYAELQLDNETEAFKKNLLTRSGFREETLFPFNSWPAYKIYSDFFIRNKNFHPTAENQSIDDLLQAESDAKLKKYIYALKECRDQIESRVENIKQKKLVQDSSKNATPQISPVMALRHLSLNETRLLRSKSPTKINSDASSLQVSPDSSPLANNSRSLSISPQSLNKISLGKDPTPNFSAQASPAVSPLARMRKINILSHSTASASMQVSPLGSPTITTLSLMKSSQSQSSTSIPKDFPSSVGLQSLPYLTPAAWYHSVSPHQNRLSSSQSSLRNSVSSSSVQLSPFESPYNDKRSLKIFSPKYPIVSEAVKAVGDSLTSMSQPLNQKASDASLPGLMAKDKIINLRSKSSHHVRWFQPVEKPTEIKAPESIKFPKI